MKKNKRGERRNEKEQGVIKGEKKNEKEQDNEKR